MTADTATPVAEVSAPESRRAYHYVITLQWEDDRAKRTASYAAVVTAGPATRRHELFIHALRTAREFLGASDDAIVIFVMIEPDDLG